MTALPKLPSVLLELRKDSGILQVILNTPKTYNSFDDQRYQDIIDALKYAQTNQEIKAVMLSAKGKFFSSGAALSQERLDAIINGKGAPAVNASMAQKYVDVLIDFPKLLIACVHGPAYGISVTTLPFFDIIYASPRATFTTPFSTLGICLEGCSSVTFPSLLGHALSSRLLYLAETVTVDELKFTGLVTEIIPEKSEGAGIEAECLKRVEAKLQALVIGSVEASKALVRDEKTRTTLHEINAREIQMVAERSRSEDHKQALIKFQEKRKAKKGGPKL